MRGAPRLLLGVVLAISLAGCAFIGHAVHGGTVALGAAAGAAVAGPAGAAGGALAGDWGGEILAEQLTGTRGVRVSPDGKVLPSASAGSALADDIADAAGIPRSTDMTKLLLLLAAGFVFVQLGGIAWLRKQIKVRAAEDDKWASETSADRAAHKARTEALERECAQLRAEINELREKVARPPLQP